MPTASTMTPKVIAVTINTACTQKKPVGSLAQALSPQARGSSTIALANRGQITTLNTPAATSNHAELFEITAPSHHTPRSTP